MQPRKPLNSLVGTGGAEPNPLPDYESGVLPLHYVPRVTYLNYPAWPGLEPGTPVGVATNCNEIMWNQFRYAKRAADPAKTEDLLLTHDLFVTKI